MGLSIPHWIKDVIIAFAVLIVTMLIRISVAVLFENLGSFVFRKPHIPFIYSSTISEMIWICVTALVVGFGEELLIRGYLLSRLLRIIGPVMSVIASSLVFAAWHIPTGVGAGVHTFIWGVVYGWTFVKIRRLYPLALAHAVNNAIAYLWI